MKLLLTILGCLVAASAGAQTIKSLSYNTTNGQVVYSGTNPLTFTNSLQFATNARAATRTNLGGTTVGNAVFTATNAAAAATAVGLGETNSVTFSQVTVTNTFYPPTFTSTNGFYGAGSLRMTGSTTNTRLVYRMLGATPADRTVLNAEDNLINLSSASVARTNLGLGATWLTNTDVTNFRTAIGLGATNNVSFNQLTATGNVTLNGSDNLMPNATNAASASSLMTRSLVFRAQADDNSGDLVAVSGNTVQIGTGALAAANNVIGGNAQVSTNSNSVAGVYFADNIWANSTVTGQVMPSGKTIDLTMKGVNFRNLTNTNYVVRVVAGVGNPTRTIPAAGQDALSTKGWGVNFFYDGTNHVFQPFWYTTNYNTGPQTVVSNAAANDNIFSVRLRHVGPTTNGTISFWINDGLASRLSETPSFSTNVGNWGGNFVGRHYAIESATATNAAPASTTSIRVRAAYIKYEP